MSPSMTTSHLSIFSCISNIAFSLYNVDLQVSTVVFLAVLSRCVSCSAIWRPARQSSRRRWRELLLLLHWSRRPYRTACCRFIYTHTHWEHHTRHESESCVGSTVSSLSSSQTKLAVEAQAKYERELMLHAADVEALQELKKRAQQEAAQKRELDEQVNKTSSLLQEKTAAWNTVERQLKVGRPAWEGKREDTGCLWVFSHNFV